jgi:hypothetical protein
LPHQGFHDELTGVLFTSVRQDFLF